VVNGNGNASEVCNRRRAPYEGHEFIVFFLNDDERQSVDVGEVEEVNSTSKAGRVGLHNRRQKPRLKIISRKVIYTEDLQDLKKGEEEWCFAAI